MLLFAAPDWPVGPGVPLVLLSALALDALIGDPHWLPHPIRLMGWLTGLLDRTLNRERLGVAARVFLGAVAVLLVAGVSAAAGWLIADQASALGWGWLAELALVTMLFAQRTMADHMVRVARALDTGADPARAELRHIVGRDVRALDEHGIARAAIESGAENYSDGVVAPAFWYLLLGLPGLLAYKAINTMDSMIGHRSPRHHAFGRAAARIDDAVNWVPARIAGGLIAAAAVVVLGAAPGRKRGAPWCAMPPGTARPMPAGPRPRWPAHSASPCSAPAATRAKRRPTRPGSATAARTRRRMTCGARSGSLRRRARW